MPIATAARKGSARMIMDLHRKRRERRKRLKSSVGFDVLRARSAHRSPARGHARYGMSFESFAMSRTPIGRTRRVIS
jgi:hypothetical protein